MKGAHIGSLSVYSTTNYGKLENKIWAISGDQGRLWNKAKVTLSSDKDFQVIRLIMIILL